MKKNKLVIGLFILFICLLGLTIYTSFSSNIDTQKIIIKSMIPVYDETSTIEVDNEKVIFNDKNQVVKYNVVLENTQDYDVKISDIKLSTPTEEFLQYKVEGISAEDEIKANSTKELVVSFETMGIKGWGRNFADELTANINFDKIAKQDETPVEETPKEEDKQPEVPATNIEEVINKAEKIEVNSITNNVIEFKDDIKVEEGEKVAVWIYSNPKFLGYFDIVENDGIKQIVGLEDTIKKAEITSGEHNIVLVSEKHETIGYINVYVNEEKEVLKEKPEDSTNNEETSKEEENNTEEGSKEETDNKDESSSVNKPSVNNPSSNNKDESTKGEEENEVENPYTSDKKLVGILGVATCITGVAIIIVSKNKFAKYTVFLLMLSPALTITNAEEVIEVAIKNNVSFESQNVMSKAYKYTIYCATDVYDADGNCIGDNWHERSTIYFWKYQTVIRNYYIQNEVIEIKEYEYKYDVSESQNGRVMAYLVETEDNSICINGDGNEEPCYNLYLQADGMIYPNEDASYYFAHMYNLELIDNILGLDTSNVTDMSYMFYQTYGPKANFSLDLSSFVTSNVRDMSYMFSYTGDNSTNFILDVSSFDTSNVTDMSHMFEWTGYYSTNFTLDVSNFDTSEVTDMSYMFSGAGYNSTDFTLDLGDKFDTSNVTDMSGMFYSTGSNSTEFTLDVSNFDTSNVTDMSYMFYSTGKNSTKLNTSITIQNPNTKFYSSMFSKVAIQEGTQIIVNYTTETIDLVDKIIATGEYCLESEEVYDPIEDWLYDKCVLYAYSNVVKGNLIVDVDNLAIGDEIHISGEKFNVISQTDDTITMLAQYNLGIDYKQSSVQNGVKFAGTYGWEYTPGPKEIDIQTWTTNPKTYVNAYVEYLKEELGDDTVTGDLITLKDLEELGCTVPSDYAFGSGEWDCYNSPYGWIANGQYWWTRSANSTYSRSVWNVCNDGRLNYYSNSYPYTGVRPVITISKETLKNIT